MTRHRLLLKKQTGFSMVEVLISLLLMTIGLLGISGLMLSGVNNATGMDLSSRAAQSANQIMDAMRANTTNASNYLTAYGTDPATLTGTSPQNADRKLWLEAVRRLPGGDGKIEAVGGVTGQYLVSIRFSNCLGTLSAGSNTSESAACSSPSNNSDKRTISFTFRI